MNKKVFYPVRWVVIGMIVGSVLLQGCSPAMRKKFVRQKNKSDEDIEFVPVLEPVDYPNMLETSKTRYEYFYALLKVWHKDALILIDDEHSDKQIIYTITQIKLQLEELNRILTGKAQQIVVNGIEAVDEILAYYDNPPAFRNQAIIRKQLQRLSDSAIRRLVYEDIKGDLTTK